MEIERLRPRRLFSRAQQERRGAFGELSRVERQMEDLFDRFFRDLWTPMGQAAQGAGPALDVVDQKDEVIIRADLPGLEQKDVEVEVQDNTLVLRGQRKEEVEGGEGDYYYSERWSGSFTRAVQLPTSIDANRITATFKNGVLEIHLPKAQEAKGRKIEIK